jgi:hypothetical protein
MEQQDEQMTAAEIELQAMRLIEAERDKNFKWFASKLTEKIVYGTIAAVFVAALGVLAYYIEKAISR